LDIEDKLLNQVLNEYTTAQVNMDDDNRDYESYVDLLDSVRQEKEYDWNSDIRIPEFVSHVLTQSADDVSQYFQTRDFVEVYINDESDQAKAASEAVKELQNRTLNQRELYHYPKFIRARTINNLVGKVYAKCRWIKKRRTIQVPETRLEPTGLDIDGNDIMSPDQVPGVRQVEEMADREFVETDRFDYQIYDQRNVFTDDTYTYSIQDKKSIIFRDPMTLSEIESIAEDAGYKNIDKLKDLVPQQVPDSKEATTERPHEPADTAAEREFDVLERYGKFWVKAEKEGNALVYGTEEIGLDTNGEPLDDAELRHVIITVVKSGGKSVLIGFRLTPFVDSTGKPFIPAIRGLCYIHPTDDGGMGDGKHTRELQVAIDDTFNISQDRTMLATLPVFKGRKRSIEDNDDFYIKPGHMIPMTEPDDVQELVIQDNIQAALNQMSVLENKMRQVDSVQPPGMGQVPSEASTTATAVASAAQGQSKRNQYKSLTFEYTFLTELYWMINQMTYLFAEEETLIKLMGDKVYNFDPSLDFYYKPLSQSIETEQSKMVKRKELTTLLSYVIQIQHPDAVKVVNYFLGEITKLMGDEYSNFMTTALDEKTPIVAGSSAQPAAQYGGAVNQTGMMPGSEQSATQMAANGMTQ
jgi:hypothetical protein